ncbi:MAG: hypothetical protein V1724_10005 [Chloroflexota bacterium]
MTTDSSVDEAWGKLADTGEDEREAQMAQRYTELSSLSEEARRSRLLAMAKAEYALPDAKLSPFTRSRMRVWLKMDPENAKKVAISYSAIMNQMPGPAAMRRVALVQTLARGFSLEDQERLAALVPQVFPGRPTIVAEVLSTTPSSTPPASKKQWWAFWRRS